MTPDAHAVVDTCCSHVAGKESLTVLPAITLYLRHKGLKFLIALPGVFFLCSPSLACFVHGMPSFTSPFASLPNVLQVLGTTLRDYMTVVSEFSLRMTKGTNQVRHMTLAAILRILHLYFVKVFQEFMIT